MNERIMIQMLFQKSIYIKMNNQKKKEEVRKSQLIEEIMKNKKLS